MNGDDHFNCATKIANDWNSSNLLMQFVWTCVNLFTFLIFGSKEDEILRLPDIEIYRHTSRVTSQGICKSVAPFSRHVSHFLLYTGYNWG